MTQEALKLELEALKSVADHRPNDETNAAIVAIKKALAQPEQEPVAFLVDGDLYYPEEIDWETLQEQGHTVTSLYTTPPQRKLVGLTKREVETLAYKAEGNTWTAVELTEAKLKEKNT